MNDQISQLIGESIANVGAYIQIRIETLSKPNDIQARINRCGNCKEKQALEAELKSATESAAMLKLFEKYTLKLIGMQPNKYTRALA